VGRLEAALADGGTPVEAYADLLGALRKEEALRGVLWRDLVEAIEREREIDLAVPWWRWGRARGEERVRAYDALKARIGRLRNDRYGEIKKLSPKTALAMYDQVETLKKDVRTISGPGAAYARLGKLLCEGRGVGGDARETLTAAIDRERGTDWHIGTHLEVPPERRTVDQPWYGWTGPLVWWLVLLTLFVILQFCLAALLRRQWVDHEKLLFPHVEMLEAVTEPGPSGAPGGGILRNRLFWVGFIFAVLLFAIEGVHHYWPKVPGFDLKEISLKPLLTKRPWTAIPAGLDLHLFVIAITFLLPSEISLSLWVFVLLDMMVKLYLVATGETHHVHEPICGYLTNGGTDQVAGMTVFMLVLMYAARRHFRGVLRKAFGGGKDIDDSEEPLPYFGAFWGLVLSAVGILLWCYIMGMSPFLSVILFGLTIIAVMFLARIVCELGIVTGSYQEPTMPQYLTAGTFGYRTQVGRMTLWNRLMFMTPTYTTWAFLWGPLFYGTHVMPMTMTSERMFRHGQSRRRFTFFLMLLTVAVMIVFAVRAIGIPYEEGAMRQKQGFHNRSGHMFGNCLARDFIRKEAMHKPFKPMYGGAISGVVIMSVLLTLRHLFYWWPVHPIGYICAGLSGGVWFSVFLGWLIKRGVLKYGGGKLFRTTIPLFVGLLVGHFVMGGIWLIAGAWAEALKQEGVYTAIWAQPYGR